MVSALERMVVVGTGKSFFFTRVASDGSRLVLALSSPTTVVETLVAAKGHVRCRTGAKRQGGVAPCLETQSTALGSNVRDTSRLTRLVGLDPGQNWVTTAYSVGPRWPAFRAAPRVRATWPE